MATYAVADKSDCRVFATGGSLPPLPLADSPTTCSRAEQLRVVAMLQPSKDLYRTLRETLFVRFVFTVLAPFIFVLEAVLRSHYRKVNGDRTPGLTRYRQ
ncbi:hypothetical protein PHYPSEUDO_009767 [Phytophthora pseudosyringae]|uniref:Uncharacterized protein n=1 Tax=Phytophthora pseudosyringae TaxID=221518 RepID=A0A8T1VF06_9STRA|nr:hypothetical protein PHYPSEUDO_009767 [Phytophthora pseudosyringae]